MGRIGGGFSYQPEGVNSMGAASPDAAIAAGVKQYGRAQAQRQQTQRVIGEARAHFN